MTYVVVPALSCRIAKIASAKELATVTTKLLKGVILAVRVAATHSDLPTDIWNFCRLQIQHMCRGTACGKHSRTGAAKSYRPCDVPHMHPHDMGYTRPLQGRQQHATQGKAVTLHGRQKNTHATQGVMPVAWQANSTLHSL